MLKKLGMVTVGAAAGLVALAPIASATESCGHDTGHSKSHEHGSHVDNSKHKNASKCSFTGGTAEAGSGISGNSLANAVAQAPVAGNNIGNIADCSSFLNDNLNGNTVLSNNSILGQGLPSAPAIP